jgi:hypothetical protein
MRLITECDARLQVEVAVEEASRVYAKTGSTIGSSGVTAEAVLALRNLSGHGESTRLTMQRWLREAYTFSLQTGFVAAVTRACVAAHMFNAKDCRCSLTRSALCRSVSRGASKTFASRRNSSSSGGVSSSPTSLPAGTEARATFRTLCGVEGVASMVSHTRQLRPCLAGDDQYSVGCRYKATRMRWPLSQGGLRCSCVDFGPHLTCERWDAWQSYLAHEMTFDDRQGGALWGTGKSMRLRQVSMSFLPDLFGALG